MVSGFFTSPLDHSRIFSGDANPILNGIKWDRLTCGFFTHCFWHYDTPFLFILRQEYFLLHRRKKSESSSSSSGSSSTSTSSSFSALNSFCENPIFAKESLSSNAKSLSPEIMEFRSDCRIRLSPSALLRFCPRLRLWHPDQETEALF